MVGADEVVVMRIERGVCTPWMMIMTPYEDLLDVAGSWGNTRW